MLNLKAVTYQDLFLSTIHPTSIWVHEDPMFGRMPICKWLQAPLEHHKMLCRIR